MEGDIAVWLLGGIESRRPTGPAPIAGEKLQALVAVLALAAPHAVSSDRLIDDLWGDDQPAHPANALQAQVSQLRRVLGRDAVARRGQGYVLNVAPDAVDTIRLERLVRDGRMAASRGDHDTAAERYEAAVALVRGPPLTELGDYRFARQAASRIEEIVMAAHEGLADAKLAIGRHGDAVAGLTDLVRSHPLRERFHAQLIVALYRCGRQAEALTAYQDARRALVEELGVDPGPELQALEQAVLAQDPALAATGVTTLVTPETAPPRPPSPGRIPLVGREEELQSLRGDLAEVMAGRGRVALLAGEPGIGKTRLAEELAADAVEQGAAIVWGRCYEGRGAPAFWPWTQIVNGLLALIDAGDRAAVVGSAGGRAGPDRPRAARAPHRRATAPAPRSRSGPVPALPRRIRLCAARSRPRPARRRARRPALGRRRGRWSWSASSPATWPTRPCSSSPRTATSIP